MPGTPAAEGNENVPSTTKPAGKGYMRSMSMFRIGLFAAMIAAAPGVSHAGYLDVIDLGDGTITAYGNGQGAVLEAFDGNSFASIPAGISVPWTATVTFRTTNSTPFSAYSLYYVAQGQLDAEWDFTYAGGIATGTYNNFLAQGTTPSLPATIPAGSGVVTLAYNAPTDTYGAGSEFSSTNGFLAYLTVEEPGNLVPEPAGLAVLGAGLATLLMLRRRQTA